MKKWLLPIVVLWSLIAVTVIYVQRVQSDFVPMGGDFVINSTKGEFRLEDYRGKVVVLYFGYRFCPDVCPTTLSDIAAMKRRLSASEQADLQVLFVSVDPNRDTMEVLKEYVNFFDETFIGARAEKQEIDRLADMYGAKYIIQETTEADPNSYTVDHSSEAFIIGKDGELKDIIPYGESVSTGSDKLKLFLKEKV